MEKKAVIIGVLSIAVLLIVLSLSAAPEPLTELWLLDHRAYLGQPVVDELAVATSSTGGIEVERITVRGIQNITTTERIKLPVNYLDNLSYTFALRSYPIVGRVNGVLYASREVSVEPAAAVQVRGLVGLRNREGRDMAYPYTVTEYANGFAVVVAESTANVPAGEAVGIPVVFIREKTLTSRTRIEVALTGRSEKVQFWLEPGRAYRVAVS